MKVGTKLATASTLEGIEKLINRYFYSTSCKVNPETFEITNSKGKISNVKVEKKKGRFIFKSI